MRKLFFKTVSAFIISVFLFSNYGILANAQEADMQSILKRLDALEQENQSLKAEVAELKNQSVEAPAVAAPSNPQSGKFSLTAQQPVQVEMYGYARTDVVWDDSQNSPTAYSAPNESSTHNVDSFNIDPRNTRLGFNLSGPDVGTDGKLSGNIEADFAAGSGSGTNPELRLRHGYAKLAYPKWSVLAGQTWAFFSPLNPNIFNTGTLWRAGNLAARNPQVRFSYNMPDILGGKVVADVGALDSRNADQENRGYPVGGAHLSWDGKVFGKSLKLGVGGIAGQYTQTVGSNLPIWAFTTDATLKLNDKFNLSGETYVGQQLADFFGGSPIPSVPTGGSLKAAVKSNGGWAQVTFKPTKKWEFNTGAGVDFTNTDYYAAYSSTNTFWRMNRSTFANGKYRLTDNFWVGLEYQNFGTVFGDNSKGTDNRIQSTVIYAF
ncbi:MAG: hypothetical protein HQL25_01375 [Candidatus Omnitrophica bacterium]|nr:hypothetical protein [Candidatus Omnitrophota bacterium]